MCGIFGIIGSVEDVNRYKRCSESVKYRGPDDFESLSDNTGEGLTFYLAHSRLIINGDLKRGKQPVKSLNGNILLFNGEIFDYDNKDYKGDFITDTERLSLDLDKDFSIEYLNKLNGFFAIVFYSKIEDSFYLIRDRFGEKPLYYHYSDGCLVFSSTGKGVQYSGHSEFSSFGFVRGGGIAYKEDEPAKNIKQVPAGHFLKFSKSEVSLHQWYKLTIDQSVHSQKDFSKLVDDFDLLLQDACRIRISDQRDIAVSISGGVDSTLILDTISLVKSSDQKIVPFTYSVDDAEFNELDRVNKTISKLNMPNLCVVHEESLYQNDIDSLLRIVEFPSFNLSFFGYNVFYKRISKSGFRVVLEGHGPDEILGGYAISHVLYIVYCLRTLKMFRFFKAFISHKEIFGTSLIVVLKNILQNLFISDVQNLVYNKNWELFSTSSLPNVLRTFDRITMFNNLESRSPFLDYRVVRFLFSISPDFIFYNDKPKSILLHLLVKRGYKAENFKRKIGFTSDFSKLYSAFGLTDVGDRHKNFNSAMRMVNTKMEILFNEE
jgi:asparagine synthase (glutamine-hydrolysing)